MKPRKMYIETWFSKSKHEIWSHSEKLDPPAIVKITSLANFCLLNEEIVCENEGEIIRDYWDMKGKLIDWIQNFASTLKHLNFFVFSKEKHKFVNLREVKNLLDTPKHFFIDLNV